MVCDVCDKDIDENWYSIDVIENSPKNFGGFPVVDRFGNIAVDSSKISHLKLCPTCFDKTMGQSDISRNGDDDG